MSAQTGGFRFTAEEAQARLPDEPSTLRFATVFERGNLLVELYAPKGEDLQTPHEQGHPFGPGDALFVPAGRFHGFENFTEGFETRVVFYGPPGGEESGA